MTFISFEYVIFLISLTIFYYIVPKKYRYLILLAGSYIFYIISSGLLFFYLIISTLSIYSLGLLLDRENMKMKIIGDELSKEEKKQLKNKIKNNKRLIILGGIIINFGILAVLKYGGFFAKNINIFLNIFHISKIPIIKFILPLGISYYTLMAVSYIVDVYRNKYKADENLLRVALYLSFFPQMTEGPIANYEDTADNLYQGQKFNIDNIKKGIFQILVGVFKVLVIAHRAGIFVDTLFSMKVSGYIIFVGALMYTLQIYADFSGCMDIVCGTARLFNITLPENFKRPFFSKNIQEFWRRWHVTLGNWIKNYIFYPISLSKFNMKISGFFKRIFPKKMSAFLIIAFPLLFVWLYNGIWHGASWKYIFYGLYYYVLIMIGILLKPLLEKIRKILKIKDNNFGFKIYEILRTTLFVVIGMMIFRSHSLMTFISLFKNMFAKANNNLLNFGLTNIDFIILIIYILLLLLVGIFNEKRGELFSRLLNKNIVIRYIVYASLILGIIILGMYGEGYDASNFIYGQF